MKILITGADVLFNEVNNVYDVIYQGQKVFSDRLKSTAVMFALSKERLDAANMVAPRSNVVYMNARVG